MFCTVVRRSHSKNLKCVEVSLELSNRWSLKGHEDTLCANMMDLWEDFDRVYG